MITLLRKIWQGLSNFFSIVASVVLFIPRCFRSVWRFFGMIKDFVGFLPASLGVLAMLVVVVSVAYLIWGR